MVCNFRLVQLLGCILHILLVSHYYEPDSGAAAVRLSRLMKILHQRGHETFKLMVAFPNKFFSFIIAGLTIFILQH